MMRILAAALCFALLVSHVNAQVGRPVAADARVRCYTEEMCGGTELSSETSAANCCAFAQMNGTSFVTIPGDGEVSAVCLECVLIGFSQSQFAVQRNRPSDTVTIELLGGRSSDGISLDVSVGRFEDPNNSVRNVRAQQLSFATGVTSVEYNAFSLGTGDGIALQPDLVIQLGLAPSGSFPPRAGIILDPSLTDLVIHDPDIIQLRFTAEQFEALEGTALRPIVSRTLINLARNLEVFVTPGVVPPDVQLAEGQFPAQLADFVSTPQTIVFNNADGATSRDADIQTVADDINERMEIVQFTLSVGSGDASSVNIITPTSLGEIADDDPLSIGFNPREVNVTEGSAAIITIIESTKLFPLNGGRRQTAQTMFNRAQLLFVQDTAVAADYTFNANQVPDFMTTNSLLNDLVISNAITAVADGLLERMETFFVEVAPVLDQYNVDQRIGDVQVNIFDADSVTIRVENPDYTVREDEGPLEVCVVAEGANIGPGIVVELQLQQNSFTDGSAIDGEDYNVPAQNALLVSFQMNQNRSCISIPIINDEVSEPSPETFTITLPPTDYPGLDITVDTTPSTVNIIDDDPSVVRYAQDAYSFGEDETGNITVELDGNVVTDFTVTVYEIGASFSQVVTFPAASGADQSIDVPIPIVNNEIALEDDLVRRFGLRDLSTTLVTIGTPSETEVTIVDEDVVEVRFSQSEYTFSEGDNPGTVNVEISREIAKDLQVNVFGSSPPQNNVVISGGDVDQNVTFTAGSTAGTSQPVSVTITDDDIALENVEEYPLTIRNPSITNNVQLGSDTNIRITDNDATTVRYAQDSYTFSEADGSGDITVVLDGSAVTDVSVTVFEIEGTFSQVVTFPSASGANQRINVPITIVNNEIALEDDLVRRFGLRDLSTAQATIGTPSETTVTIEDDDVVEVTFSESVYTFPENVSPGTVNVEINRQIAKNLQVNVFGSSPTQTNVVISGGDVNQDVTFTAGSTAGTSQPVSVTITDDNVALENVEEYPLTIRNPSITNNVQLGSDTNIRITDNDTTTVQFVQPTYTFSEAVVTAEIQVTLSNPVAIPVTATVTGGPGNQPAGVVISGSVVNQLVPFPAIVAPTPVPVTFNVTNDVIAQEPNEVYPLSITATTTGVNAGPDTTIIITDDDTASIQFEEPTYTFNEGPNDGTITVVLNGAVSSPLSVTVTDGTLTETITFVALTPNQEIDVTVPIVDNNIALEPDIVRNFRLEQISDPDVPAVTPSTTVVTIVDDDDVSVGYAMESYTFSESTNNAMVTLRASNPVASSFTVRVQGGPGTQPPSVVISGSDINQVYTFPASTTAESISVPVGITDDDVGLEEPEVYRLLLTDVDQRVTLGGDDLFTTTLITIEDDDVVTVTTDTPAISVPEDGSTIDVCVTLSRDAAVPVIVTFNTIETTATVGADFNVVSSSVTIPAGQRNGCVQYEILMDNVVEGNETFTAQISTVTTGAVIGNPSSTVVTIIDMTPSGCVFTSTGSIITFPGEPDGQEYQFARPCEHALLSSCAMNAISPSFGVFIDTTDGTLSTGTLGVRLDGSTVIVDSDLTVTTTGSLITVQELPNMVLVTIPSLDITIMRTTTQITVAITDSSSLVRDCGLCGTRTGDLVLPNGNTVTQPSEAFITAYMIPPTDTFVLPNRDQCGLMVNDSVRGDPVYTVPIQTSDTRPTETLCYEIYGSPDQYFNLVSDECVNVNAHYSAFDRRVRPLHIVDQIAIRAIDSTNRCVNIAARVESDGQCKVVVGGNELQNTGGIKYSQNAITVRSYARRARVTVPNCDNNRLVMWVICEERFGYHSIFFKISRGFNLRPSSHGLIAQFWNIVTTVEKYTDTLPGGGDNSKAYTVTIRPVNSPERRVGAFRENIQWDQTPLPCLYAGNSQGGALSEFQNLDNLIEGSLEDYHMNSAFDTTSFTYRKFKEDMCTN